MQGASCVGVVDTGKLVGPAERSLGLVCGSGGALGLGEKTATTTTPSTIPLPDTPNPLTVAAAAASPNHTLLVSDVGDVFAVGDGRWGQLGVNSAHHASRPRRVPLPLHAAVAGVAATATASFAWAGGAAHRYDAIVQHLDAQVVAVGKDLRKLDALRRLRFGDSSAILMVANEARFALLQLERSLRLVHYLRQAAAHAQGQLYAWGSGRHGELGMGAVTLHQPLPAVVGGPRLRVAEVVAGNHHVLARTHAGELYAWGRDHHGQLGRGRNAAARPVVDGVVAVTRMSAANLVLAAAAPDSPPDADTYLSVALLDARGLCISEQCSGTAAGADPCWAVAPHNLLFLPFAAGRGAAVSLLVEAWVHDPAAEDDALLGAGTVDLTPLVGRTMQDTVVTCRLMAVGGDPRGTVTLTASFYVLPAGMPAAAKDAAAAAIVNVVKARALPQPSRRRLLDGASSDGASSDTAQPSSDSSDGGSDEEDEATGTLHVCMASADGLPKPSKLSWAGNLQVRATLYTGRGRKSSTYRTGCAASTKAGVAWGEETGATLPMAYRLGVDESVELLVTVFDVRRFRKDAPLAHGAMDVTSLVAGGARGVPIVVELATVTEQPVPGGRLHMALTATSAVLPPPPGPPVLVRGVLRLKVCEAVNLGVGRAVGRHDPFVRVTVFSPYGQAAAETGVVWHGGANPKWSDKHSNHLKATYTAARGGSLRMCVEVLDADVVGASEALGTSDVDLSAMVGTEASNTPYTATLRDPTGEHFAGILKFTLSVTKVAGVVVGDPAKQRPLGASGAVRVEPRAVSVHVWAGRGLGGEGPPRPRLAPFVVVKLLGLRGDVMDAAECAPVKRGGVDPRWHTPHRNRLALRFDHAIDQPVFLDVQAWGKEMVRNSLLGAASVDITALLAHPRAKQRLVVRLRDPLGVEPRGDVALTLTVDSPECPDALADLPLSDDEQVEEEVWQAAEADTVLSVDRPQRGGTAASTVRVLTAGAAAPEPDAVDHTVSHVFSADDNLKSAAPPPARPPTAISRPPSPQDLGGVHRGRLAVHVKSASGLASTAGLAGHQDPVVRLTLVSPGGGAAGEASTDPALGGGTNPKWSIKAGQRHLRYHVVGNGAGLTLSVSVFDHNARSSAAPLGVGFLDLAPFVGGDHPPTAMICPLRSVTGRRAAGVVTLSISAAKARQRRHSVVDDGDDLADAPPGADSDEDGFAVPGQSLYSTTSYQGAIEVAILNARRLKNATTFSNMNPYVTVDLLAPNGRVMSSARTCTIKGGGQAPRWGADNVCRVKYDAPRMTRLKLQCQVWHARSVGDDVLLGTARVAVPELVGRRHAGMTMEFALVDDGRREQRGKVTAVVTASVAQRGEAPPKPPARLTDVIGTPAPRVVAADLAAPTAVAAGDHRHVATPVPVRGPWLRYGHVVVAVAAGGTHSIAITQRDGMRSRRVWAWGSNGAGQLGCADTVDRPAPVELEALDASRPGWHHAPTGVAAGGAHTLLLTQDTAPPPHTAGRHTVWATGDGAHGQLGLPLTAIPRRCVTVLTPVHSLRAVAVAAVHAGGRASAAVTNQGELYVWGHNRGGELGVGDRRVRLQPWHVDGLARWSVSSVTLAAQHGVLVAAPRPQPVSKLFTADRLPPHRRHLLFGRKPRGGNKPSVLDEIETSLAARWTRGPDGKKRWRRRPRGILETDGFAVARDAHDTAVAVAKASTIGSRFPANPRAIVEAYIEATLGSAESRREREELAADRRRRLAQAKRALVQRDQAELHALLFPSQLGVRHTYGPHGAPSHPGFVRVPAPGWRVQPVVVPALQVEAAAGADPYTWLHDPDALPPSRTADARHRRFVATGAAPHILDGARSEYPSAPPPSGVPLVDVAAGVVRRWRRRRALAERALRRAVLPGGAPPPSPPSGPAHIVAWPVVCPVGWDVTPGPIPGVVTPGDMPALVAPWGAGYTMTAILGGLRLPPTASAQQFAAVRAVVDVEALPNGRVGDVKWRPRVRGQRRGAAALAVAAGTAPEYGPRWTALRPSGQQVDCDPARSAAVAAELLESTADLELGDGAVPEEFVLPVVGRRPRWATLGAAMGYDPSDGVGVSDAGTNTRLHRRRWQTNPNPNPNPVPPPTEAPAFLPGAGRVPAPTQALAPSIGAAAGSSAGLRRAASMVSAVEHEVGEEEEEAPRAQRFDVTVLEGKNLKNLDTFKKQDPYVVVTVVDSGGGEYGTQKSSTVWKGGKHPKWSASSDRLLRFEVPVDGLKGRLLLCVEAFDADMLGDDDLIGMGRFDVHHFVGRKKSTAVACDLLSGDRSESRGVIMFNVASKRPKLVTEPTPDGLEEGAGATPPAVPPLVRAPSSKWRSAGCLPLALEVVAWQPGGKADIPPGWLPATQATAVDGDTVVAQAVSTEVMPPPEAPGLGATEPGPPPPCIVLLVPAHRPGLALQLEARVGLDTATARLPVKDIVTGGSMEVAMCVGGVTMGSLAVRLPEGDAWGGHSDLRAAFGGEGGEPAISSPHGGAGVEDADVAWAPGDDQDDDLEIAVDPPSWAGGSPPLEPWMGTAPWQVHPVGAGLQLPRTTLDHSQLLRSVATLPLHATVVQSALASLPPLVAAAAADAPQASQHGHLPGKGNLYKAPPPPQQQPSLPPQAMEDLRREFYLLKRLYVLHQDQLNWKEDDAARVHALMESARRRRARANPKLVRRQPLHKRRMEARRRKEEAAREKAEHAAWRHGEHLRRAGLLAEMRVLNAMVDTVRRHHGDTDFALAHAFARRAALAQARPTAGLACPRSRWPTLSAWCGMGFCHHPRQHLVSHRAAATLRHLRLTGTGPLPASEAAIDVLRGARRPWGALAESVTALQWPPPAVIDATAQASVMEGEEWQERQQAAERDGMEAEDDRWRQWRERELMWLADTRVRDLWRPNSEVHAAPCLEKLAACDAALWQALDDERNRKREEFLAGRGRGGSDGEASESDASLDLEFEAVPAGGVFGVVMPRREVRKGVNGFRQGGLQPSARAGTAWGGLRPPAALPVGVTGGGGAAPPGTSAAHLEDTLWGVAHPIPAPNVVTPAQAARARQRHAMEARMASAAQEAKARRQASEAAMVSHKDTMVAGLTRHWKPWYAANRERLLARFRRGWRLESLLRRGAFHWAVHLAERAERVVQHAEEAEVRKEPWLRPTVAAVRAARAELEAAARERLAAELDFIGAEDLGGTVWLTAGAAVGSGAKPAPPHPAPPTRLLVVPTAGVAATAASRAARRNLELLPVRLAAKTGLVLSENAATFIEAAMVVALPPVYEAQWRLDVQQYAEEVQALKALEPAGLEHPPAPGPFQCVTCGGAVVCRSCARCCHAGHVLRAIPDDLRPRKPPTQEVVGDGFGLGHSYRHYAPEAAAGDDAAHRMWWRPDDSKTFLCECGAKAACRRPPPILEEVPDGVTALADADGCAELGSRESLRQWGLQEMAQRPRPQAFGSSILLMRELRAQVQHVEEIKNTKQAVLRRLGLLAAHDDDVLEL